MFRAGGAGTCKAARAPVIDPRILRAGRLPPGIYAEYAPHGGIWLRVRLTDPGDVGPWSWRIDWGDGVVNTPEADVKGDFLFLRTTPYPAPGAYTITASATDHGGLASANVATRVTVR